MDNQNQNTNVIFPAGDSSSSQGSAGFGQALSQPQSLEPAQVVTPQPSQSDVVQPQKEKLAVRLVKRADVLLAILLVLGSVGLVLNSYLNKDQSSSNSATGRYDTTQIPLSDFTTSEGINFGTQSVVINGLLQANDGLIVSPTLQPTSAVAGQMYYDQTSNVLAYYNGTQFIEIGGGVQSVAGLTGQINVGNGLSSAGGQLSNTGVLSVQGLTGDVSLTAGNGIGISGSTISNTGVVSVSSSSPSLVVTNDGNGNVTLSGSGAGTVNSPGGTAGRVPIFTAAQTIADSIITQSGMTVTVAGDLAVVTGGLTLSNALTVSNGGTGAASLALNGVLVGQGTGAITSVTSGGAGLCLVSTAGAPTWAVCPGGAGVDSLNGLTGALSIANASGAGSTITIDDASTVTKGIARFNATNFSAAGGVVNTVQNINTGATPTFAGVNTNNITPSGTLTVGATSQTLTLQGNGGTTITTTSGANTTTIAFTAPSANATINFPALSAGTYDICTTSGNCLGGGGGGANTALSNLTGVAINTSLLPGVAGGVNLGSSTLPFGDLFLAGTSGTPGTNNFRITGASTGGTRTITIPDATGTMCLTTGNCAGAGGGVTTPGGTIGTLPVFTGTQTLGDSLVSQTGGVVAVNGHLDLTAGNQYRINGVQISSADLSNNANLAKLGSSQTFTGNANSFQNGANSTNAFNVQNAAGTRLLTVDTSNGEVELGTGSLIDGKLVFNNVSNTNTVTVVPGTPTGNRTITLPDDSGIVCLNTGNCAGAGGTLQTAYNFSVGGTTPKIKVNSTLGGVDIQADDADVVSSLLNVRASNAGGLGSVLFGIGNTGQTTLQNSANSTTAFRVLSAGGTSVLTADTTNGQILLGQSGTLSGNVVFRNATNSNTITLTTAAASGSQTVTLPDATGEVCLTVGNCSGTGSTNTLQAAYDAGNSITTSTARNVSIALADSATDANFLIDLQCDTTCSTNGRFAIQDDGTDVFTVSPAGGAALFKNLTNSTTAFRVQNAAGSTTALNADTTNGRVGVNTATPSERLTVTGNFNVRDADTATKQYRFRTDGGGLDFEGAGADMHLSVWSGADFTGTQFTKLVLDSGSNETYALQQWNFMEDPFASPHHTINGANGGNVVFNEDSQSTDLRVEGNTDANALFLQGSTDRTGIGTNSPQAKLHVSSSASEALFRVTDATAAAVDVLNIANEGAITLQNRTNSATAFQVQDTAAAGLLTVDTATRGVSGGNLVKIGNSTGTDTALTILQLDASTVDPTSNLSALNGGLFYNSTTNKVSLIENGIVKIICNTTDLGCGTGTVTLQSAYGNGNTISATDNRDIGFNLTDQTTDPNFLIDLQCDTSCSTNGRFAIQDDGVDVLSVAPVTDTVTITSTATAGVGLTILNSNVGQTTTTLLNVAQSGVSSGFTGNVVNFQGTSTTGSGNLLNLSAANTTAGNALNVTANALTTGNAVNINSTGTGMTTGSLLRVSTGTTAAIDTNGVVSVNATGNYTSTSNNGLMNVLANSTTAGTIMNIQGGALTTGVALNIGANTGTALRVSSGLTTLTNATSGSGTTLNVSNSTSTGSIAVFQDNATTVASIADGGATLFQNQTNSANAFRILSSTSGELVGVDATDSILRMLANNTGHLSGTGSSWNTGTSLVNARASGSSVVLNGYIYQLGGCSSGGAAQAAVSFSPLRSDGSNGSWTSTTVLPFPSCGNSATTYNGYIYVHGGANNATLSRDVYYAKPNADGTITSWATQNDPTNLADHQLSGMAAYNGYLYITAGESDDGLDTRNRNLYYGRINADGSVPSFTVQSNWLTDTDHNPGQAIIANGYLYVMGSSNYDKFYYGRINNDGTVATIAQATGTTSIARKYAAITVMNGYMYAIAGNTSGSTSVDYAPLSSTGDIGTFVTDTTALPAARSVCPPVAPTYNNFVYLVGCGDSSFVAQTSMYYASGSKVRVGGGLDLTSYSGEGADAGGSGGQLTAGNTAINGALTVTGNAVFEDGAAVNNAFSVTGTANIQTTTNTTTGFQILNASAVPQFVSDTTNSRIYIGNPTSDTTGAVLVLDTKSDTGDPTGLGGAMYYNSSYGRMRCYYDSAWHYCNEYASLSLGYNITEDFVGLDDSVLIGENSWSRDVSGTGATVGGQNAENRRPGIVELDTGTSTTVARAAIYLNAANHEPIIIGGSEEIEFAANLPTLADGTNDYNIRIGLCDNTDGTDCTSGLYFEYDRDTSANWIYAAANNDGGGSRTKTTSSTAVSTGWHRFRISVNTAASSVTYYVDGVSLGTAISANIPTVSTQPAFVIAKDNPTGAASRLLRVDYFQMRNSVTTPR